MKPELERRLFSLGLNPQAAADIIRAGEQPDWDVAAGLQAKVAERSTFLDALTQADLLALDPAAAVLDVGCGGGAMTLALAAHAGMAIGVDTDWAHLIGAVEAARISGVMNARFYHGSLPELGEPALALAPASWRLIVAYQALPRQALLRAAQAAAPFLPSDGALLLVYPRFWFDDSQAWSPVEDRLRHYLASREPAWQPYSREALVAACHQAGMVVEEVENIACATIQTSGYLFWTTGMSLTYEMWQDPAERAAFLAGLGVGLDEPLSSAWLLARRP